MATPLRTQKKKLDEIWWDPRVDGLYMRVQKGFRPLNTGVGDPDDPAWSTTYFLRYDRSFIFLPFDGQSHDLTDASVYFTVMRGYTDDTSNWTFSSVDPVGCVSDFGTGANASRITVSEYTANGVVTVTAIKGEETLTYDLLVTDDLSWRVSSHTAQLAKVAEVIDVTNGELIDGAVTRMKLEADFRDGLIQTESVLWPNGFDAASKIATMEPQFLDAQAIADALGDALANAEAGVNGALMVVAGNKTKIAQLEYTIDGLTSMIGELTTAVEGGEPITIDYTLINQTAEKVRTMALSGTFLEDGVTLDTWEKGQIDVLSDKIALTVESDGAGGWNVASTIITEDSIASAVAAVVADPASTEIRSTLSEIVMETDAIRLSVEETIERLDGVLEQSHAGVNVSNHNVFIEAQARLDMGETLRSYVDVRSDGIDLVVSELGSSLGSEISILRDRIDIDVFGPDGIESQLTMHDGLFAVRAATDATEAFFGMGASVPLVLDAATYAFYCANVIGLNTATVDAVYVLQSDGFYRVRTTATAAQIGLVRQKLMAANLLSSQIVLSADEILLQGTVRLDHFDVDLLTAGKLKAAYIEADALSIGWSQILESSAIEQDIINAQGAADSAQATADSKTTAADALTAAQETVKDYVPKYLGVVYYGLGGSAFAIPSGNAGDWYFTENGSFDTANNHRRLYVKASGGDTYTLMPSVTAAQKNRYYCPQLIEDVLTICNNKNLDPAEYFGVTFISALAVNSAFIRDLRVTNANIDGKLTANEIDATNLSIVNGRFSGYIDTPVFKSRPGSANTYGPYTFVADDSQARNIYRQMIITLGLPEGLYKVVSSANAGSPATALISTYTGIVHTSIYQYHRYWEVKFYSATGTQIGRILTDYWTQSGYPAASSTATPDSAIHTISNVTLTLGTGGDELSFDGLPTSNVDLSSGRVWCDGGTLKVIP